jgi:glycolate oxidase FAD binding subunit
VASALLSALAAIVGPAHCLGGTERAPYAVDGRVPCAAVFPGSIDEVSRVVHAAAAAGVPVLPWGGGTAAALGSPPPDGALVVGTRRLARVVEHEPGDLTATVEAGITLQALQAALGRRGQWWPLDPPHPDRATLGGVLATSASGPRRHLHGTARDLVIGLAVVTPAGTIVRAGGKVVKNVAGYDLVKLHLGALGTLGLVVEATLKLRPRPGDEGACWAGFPTVAAAAAGVAAIQGSTLVPEALELLDPGAVTACAPAAALDAGVGPAAVLVAFEGVTGSVAWQQQEATRLLAAQGATAIRALDAVGTVRALDAVREVRALVPAPLAVATAAVPPAELGAFLAEAGAALQGAALGLAAAAHAGAGVARLVVSGDDGGSAAAVTAAALARCRAAARARGGHLVVEAAPLAVRELCPPWDDPGPAGALMRGLKTRLDPRRLMNPGRFVGGL